MSKIHALIIDDHKVVAEGLTKVFEADGRVEVIATASSLAEAWELVGRVQPDVVLVDLRLPDSQGYDAIASARRAFPKAKVIAITGYGGNARIAIEKYGADAFISKSLASDIVTRTVFELCPVAQERPESPRALSGRELEVAKLVAGGLTNEEIASRLTLSLNTVKTHVSSTLKKLGLRRRLDLALYLSHRKPAE